MQSNHAYDASTSFREIENNTNFSLNQLSYNDAPIAYNRNTRSYARESSLRFETTIIPPPETTRPIPQSSDSLLSTGADTEVRRNMSSSTTFLPQVSPTSNHNRMNETISTHGDQLYRGSTHQDHALSSPNSYMVPNHNIEHSSPINVQQPTQQLQQRQQVAWQQVHSNELDTSIADLRAIMQEQEDEQQARYQEMMYRNDSIGANEVSELGTSIAVQAQEEEFIRLAIEMSLTETTNSSQNFFNQTSAPAASRNVNNDDDNDSIGSHDIFLDADEDRQLSKRAGSWRSSYSGSDRTTQSFNGREVVLEMARRFLHNEEVQVIQAALQQHDFGDYGHGSGTSIDFSSKLPAIQPSNCIDQAGSQMSVTGDNGEDNPDSFVSAFVTAVSSSQSTGSMTSKDKNTLRKASSKLSNTELSEMKRALISGTNRFGNSVSRPGCVAVSVRTFANDEYREIQHAGYPIRYQREQQQPLPAPDSVAFDLSSTAGHLTQQELQEIRNALGGEAILEGNHFAQPSPRKCSVDSEGELSPEESAEILKAIQEADALEERKSLELARRLQLEQDVTAGLSTSSNANNNRQQNVGNIRTMTRQEYENERKPKINGQGYSDEELDEYDDVNHSSGFRMNANRNDNASWRRLDQNAIIGPNNEVRTKHDQCLDGATNVERLGLESAMFPTVGNKAYNSFLQSVKKKKKKGVETSGTGRAGSDTDATRGGAMDPNVRVQITKAINNEYIEVCNGVVKEGKEAIVYHASKGSNSGGFDVAVKVFKRIQEFRGRGEYVDGDPRYSTAFKNAGAREQIELWTEKEFRNLVRANRVGVPVPTPLFHKENVLFMRFLGEDGWPAPQLREIDLRRGSSQWASLFWQILKAIRLLYHHGRLVHGDLSEYNVLVVPTSNVENTLPSDSEITADSNKVNKGTEEELQAVLIDFGQAVDTKHPNAIPLLERDLDRIIKFFELQEIEIMSVEEALVYVTDPPQSLTSEVN